MHELDIGMAFCRYFDSRGTLRKNAQPIPTDLE